MAILTTTRSGNWSDTSGTTPWTALVGSGTGGVAGVGDRVIVNSGHTLTVDGTQACGSSGPNAPSTAATVSPSAGASVTSLPAGNYYVRITAVNASGESSTSAESAVLTIGIAPNNQPRITLPALPTGGTSWSIYLTNTGTGAGGLTHRRYATGKAAGNFEPVSASWEDGTVAFASAQLIAPASAIWATGILNVAAGASLTVSGDVQTTNSSGSTLSAGATVSINVPATQTYYWSPGGFSNGNVSPLLSNGSSGSRTTIQRTGSGIASISAMPLAASFNGRGLMQASYTNFIDLGSASVDAAAASFYLVPTFSLTDCIMTRCGQFRTANAQPDQNVTISRNRWSGSLATNCMLMDLGSSYTSGTRLFNRNVLDAVFQFTSGAVGWTIDDNFYGNNIVMSGITASPTSFKRNFWGRTDPSAGGQPTVGLQFGCTDNVYHVSCSSAPNPHGIDPAIRNVDATISGWVFDGLTADNSGDLILPNTGTPASTYTLTIKNNVYLPNLRGDNVGTPCTLYGNSKLKVNFEHNTYVMGIQGFSYGEFGGYAGAANMIPSFQSNIAWNPSKLSTGYLLWDALGSPFDATPGQVTTCDYNGKYNYSDTTAFPNADTTVLAKGYLTSTVANGHYVFVQTPANVGAHDVDGDPVFYDKTRSTQTFDQGYLAQPKATDWASGQSYIVGDIRASAVSGAFFSLPINYRCITAHTSTASGVTGPPGSGVAGATINWSTYWEPASFEYIRQSLLAGTTYDGTPLGGSSGVSIIEVLRLWIRRGFAPTSASYRNAGHDGVTIGAVEYTAPGGASNQNLLLLGIG